MSKITYTDKVTLNENPNVADINKVRAGDLNEIKNVVNANDDNVGDLADLKTADVSSVVNAINEINDKFNYTQEEQRIGTWIDGKPIYRKVINCGALPNATNKIVNHNIQNIGHSYIYGTAIRSSDKREFPLPFAAASAGSEIQLDLTNTAIQITTSVDRSAFDQTYVIIEYTKTTD